MIEKVFITGYKPQELGIFKNNHPGVPYIKKAIENRLIPLIEDGLKWVIITGQLGVELWAAEMVIELKKEYPELKLMVLTPFLNQEKNWKEETQIYYNSVVSKADFINSITKTEYIAPWQFSLKNKFVLDNTEATILLYDDERESVSKYIKEEAEKRVENEGYELFIINSYDLQMVVEEEQQKNWDY